jgi:Ni2+-binding GTPase involved in maturation of urease and hydrogenase
MSESIFDQILNDLLNLMIRGHDMITKSSAVIFIQDIILENKIDLISPKNARKIAQRLIEVY